ncbi:class I SAM-dependent methyltransferase [Flindersiella endophytica]
MSPDRWAEWLLERRHGGDAERLRSTLEFVGKRRDIVLDRAEMQPGDTVLDVGCGDGLLGFGALERVGPNGRVIFSDHSADLLERCRELAADLGVTDRCEFIETELPGLEAVADASVDVAMTRSVLIYVDDKAGSFEALHRVLRPGGRLSIFEPINRFGTNQQPNLLWGVDFTGLEPIVAKVEAAQERNLVPTMLDFDERDLIALAEAAGFGEVHLEYRVDIRTTPADPDYDWDGFLVTSPNPLAPTYAELLDGALTPHEQEALRERYTTSPRHRRMAAAYLWCKR